MEKKAQLTLEYQSGVLLELSERLKLKIATEREHNIVEYKNIMPFFVKFKLDIH